MDWQPSWRAIPLPSLRHLLLCRLSPLEAHFLPWPLAHAASTIGASSLFWDIKHIPASRPLHQRSPSAWHTPSPRHSRDSLSQKRILGLYINVTSEEPSLTTSSPAHKATAHFSLSPCLLVVLFWHLAPYDIGPIHSSVQVLPQLRYHLYEVWRLCSVHGHVFCT